jgi:hypothetical protein
MGYRMIFLTEKDTGIRFSFYEDEISELGHFQIEEAIANLGDKAVDLLGDEKYGYWKMMTKSGRLFHAHGTTREYDKLVRVLVKRHKKGK